MVTEWQLRAARPLDLPAAETPQDVLPPVPRDEWDEGVGTMSSGQRGEKEKTSGKIHVEKVDRTVVASRHHQAVGKVVQMKRIEKKLLDQELKV